MALYLAHLFWWPTRALLSVNGCPRLGPVAGPVAPHPGQWSPESVAEEVWSPADSISRMLSFEEEVSSVEGGEDEDEDEVDDEVVPEAVVSVVFVGWGCGVGGPKLGTAVRRSLYLM